MLTFKGVGGLHFTKVQKNFFGLRSLSSNRPPRFISKSKIGEKSIQYKGSQIWNVMSLKLKNCELFSQFKTSYKNHLLETEIDSSIFLNQTDLLLSSWLVLSIQHTFPIDLLVSHRWIFNTILPGCGPLLHCLLRCRLSVASLGGHALSLVMNAAMTILKM